MLEHVGAVLGRSRWWPGRARSRRPRPGGSRPPRCPRRASRAPPRWSRGRARSRPRRRRPWRGRARAACRLSAWKTSAPMRRHSEKLGGAAGHDHELLEVDLVVGVGAAVEHVHHRHRQHVRRLAAEVAPQRQPLLGRLGVRGRERDAEDRVGAEPRLVRRCRRARSCARSSAAWSAASMPLQRRGDLAVDVGHGAGDALAAPALAAVAQLRRLELARRGAGGHRGAAARAGAQRRPPPRPSGLPRLSRIWRAWIRSISLMRRASTAQAGRCEPRPPAGGRASRRSRRRGCSSWACGRRAGGGRLRSFVLLAVGHHVVRRGSPSCAVHFFLNSLTNLVSASCCCVAAAAI